jgi:hypothetical protein
MSDTIDGQSLRRQLCSAFFANAGNPLDQVGPILELACLAFAQNAGLGARTNAFDAVEISFAGAVHVNGGECAGDDQREQSHHHLLDHSKTPSVQDKKAPLHGVELGATLVWKAHQGAI